MPAVRAHGHLAVDLERGHSTLDSGLEEFVEFARGVERWMNGEGRDG
jgi:hypothetical protein